MEREWYTHHKKTVKSLIVTSTKQSQKASTGLPLSPILPSMTPKRIENMTIPRTLGLPVPPSDSSILYRFTTASAEEDSSEKKTPKPST